MSQICDCYGLTRKKVEEVIRRKGLTDTDAVYAHFDAMECGVCIEDVQAILDEVLASADS